LLGEPCSCVRGYCVGSSSSCAECSNDYYGPNCNNPCTCVNGVCNNQLNGNGTCSECDYTHYGSNCIDECICTVEYECDGVFGVGACKSCLGTNFTGPYCNQSCPCEYGICNGVNGSCLYCTGNYSGPYCNISCQCVNGVCDGLDPIKGIGACSYCYNLYDVPPYCNTTSTCSCVEGQGYCISSKCVCIPPYSGTTCGNNCVDEQCSLVCEGTKSTCSNGLTFHQQAAVVSYSYIFEAPAVINDSTITLLSVQLTVDSNVTVLDSNIIFKQSSIVAYGCINFTNTNISVDLSKASASLLLLDSKVGCLSLENSTITYHNKSDCITTPKNQTTEGTLLIVISPQACGSPFPWYIVIIAVAALVVIIIVIVVIVLGVPSIRNKCFEKQKY